MFASIAASLVGSAVVVGIILDQPKMLAAGLGALPVLSMALLLIEL